MPCPQIVMMKEVLRRLIEFKLGNKSVLVGNSVHQGQYISCLYTHWRTPLIHKLQLDSKPTFTETNPRVNSFPPCTVSVYSVRSHTESNPQLFPFRAWWLCDVYLTLTALPFLSQSSCSPRASTIGSPTPRIRVRLSSSPMCPRWWWPWRSEEDWLVLLPLTSGRTCTVAT